MTTDVAARRRELLRKRLEADGLAHRENASAVQPRADGEQTRLPTAAQRLWFAGQRDPDDASLNISVAFDLRGALDADRLRAAFSAVVAKHETLRARYIADADGTPVMAHRSSDHVSWTAADLRDLSESATQRRLQVLAAREARTPFRLTTRRRCASCWSRSPTTITSSC